MTERSEVKNNRSTRRGASCAHKEKSMTVKQNRTEDHSIFGVSSRLKRYGADLSVFDVDSEEDTYCVSNRGVFSLIFETKACWYENGRMRAPKVSMSQLLTLFYNLQPSFLCFYSEDYCWRVIPANYAAVVWSGTRDTRIMTEEEFQVLFSSVSPCVPSGDLNKIKHTPTSYLFFEPGGKEYPWDLYIGFSGVAKQIAWYNEKNTNVADSWTKLRETLPEEVYLAHVDLWRTWKRQASTVK